MPLCVFSGCLSGNRRKGIVNNSKIHLHKFPKDVKLREKCSNKLKKVQTYKP